MRQFDVSYFAASCDTAEMNKDFAKSLELDFPILSDPSKDVAKNYGVVNAQRELPFRWTFYIGRDGKLLHIDKDVKPDSHGKDVASKLAELGIAKKK
jgi:peroxiredoxin Q/BCP